MDNSSVMSNKAMKLVREGMRVVDAKGDDIGTVEEFKMGDPEAMTTRGNESHPGEPVWPDDDEPKVPEPIRSDLLRMGFVKIDTGDIFDRDLYVRADVVDAVSNDTVTLTLPKERLAHEDSQAAEFAHQGDPRVVPPGGVGFAFGRGSGGGTSANI